MANNQTNSTNPCEHTDLPLTRTILIVVYSVIAIFSLTGNTLVVAVVCKKKRLRTNVNYFIASMAVSDLLIPLVNLPDALHDVIKGDNSWIFGSGSFGEFTCRFLPYVSEVSTAVSTLTMITIAADRFYCVLFPLKASFISDKTRWRLIAIIWIASLVLQGYYLDLRDVKAEGNCGFAWEFRSRVTQIILIFVFQFAIPFTILVVLSSAIIFTLRSDKMVPYLASVEVKRRTLRNRKITLMLVVIIVLYLAAMTPMWISLFNFYFFRNKAFKGRCYLRLVALPFFFLYTAVNPLVYYIFIDGYHKGIKEILCCSSRRSFKSAATSLKTERESFVKETRV